MARLLAFQILLLHIVLKHMHSCLNIHLLQQLFWTQVYGYRMSLWAEHLGTLEDSFCQPESLECIRQVNSIAKNNWQIYAADENKEMTGHLMQYPIQVSKNGNVSTLPGHECFPDVGGKVLGSPTNLPDALTTWQSHHTFKMELQFIVKVQQRNKNGEHTEQLEVKWRARC